MTNQAISAVLEHLCNEARNSMHATLGVMELLHEESEDSERRARLSIGRASADQLLRSIDDVRDLLSNAPAAYPAMLEEFDLVACASEIVEGLNLASGKRAKHMLLDPPYDPLVVTHDRKALEQVLTRLLDAAFKLSPTNVVRVNLIRPAKSGIRLTLSARDTELALLLTSWLNSDPDRATLQDPLEVPYGVAVMVAGKRLRSLDASAKLVSDAAGHSTVVLDIPSQGHATNGNGLAPPAQELLPDTLNVLVVEDCDDSFVLTELMLEGERVWRARDGHEALRMIQKHRFDLVLMDVHMPGMDGYAAIRGMREWETQTGNARTPIVVLSSDDLETQRQSAAQCGCSGFLRKPLQLSDLTNLLERVRQARTLVA